VSLCFLGPADKNLSKTDSGMGGGEISIQRQRMFAFGDPLRGAPSSQQPSSQAIAPITRET
jgi:hypothetical protein